MVSCKLAEFFYGIIRVPAFRDLLLRGHMDGCPECQARLVSRTQARTLFVRREEAGGGRDLWAKIRSRRELGAKETRRRSLVLEWATGAAVFVFTAALSLWLARGVVRDGQVMTPGYSRTPARFEIQNINVGGAPAQAYVYQSGDSDMILVWAEKSDQGG